MTEFGLAVLLTCAQTVLAPTTGAPAKSAAPAAQESPRLQKLKQATYDRRPSAVLRLWSNPAQARKGEKDKKPLTPLDLEIAELQRNVTLGRWDAVKVYLKKLPENEGKAGYTQLLQS